MIVHNFVLVVAFKLVLVGVVMVAVVTVQEIVREPVEVGVDMVVLVAVQVEICLWDIKREHGFNKETFRRMARWHC
jgi:hypothetical protein